MAAHAKKGSARNSARKASKKAAASKSSKKSPASKPSAKVSRKKAAAKQPAKKVGAGAKKGAAKASKASKKTPASKPAAAPRAQTAKRKSAGGEIDFSSLPAGLTARYEKHICLACVFELFTKQLGLAPRTAYSEIKRHAPGVAELTAPAAARPYFDGGEGKSARCPFCDSARRWHARLDTYRVEGGKHTDAARRALVKHWPTSEDQFLFCEEKRPAREVFFEWLDALGRRLDFEGDDQAWMLRATRALLERREPSVDWAEVFDGLRQVRRSQRLAEGWERDGARLFLAPALYNDTLLVQYLVSRSHRHGGRTLEGRLTLPEFVRRLRHAGHLDAQGITERDQFDVLERLVAQLSGGDETVKLYYLIDRRDFLDKVKTIYARYAAA